MKQWIAITEMYASVIKPFWLLVFRIMIHICITIMHLFLCCRLLCIHRRGLQICCVHVLCLPKKLVPEEKQVASEYLYWHATKTVLVFSLRILLPCSCVPTSWIRKTFLASPTPSWFSTGVTRMEREHSGWTQMFIYVFNLLPLNVTHMINM